MSTTLWIIIVILILLVAGYVGFAMWFDSQIKKAVGLQYTKVTTDESGTSSSSEICIMTEYDSNKTVVKTAVEKVSSDDSYMFNMWNPLNWPWINKNYTIIHNDSDVLSWDSSNNIFMNTDSSKDFVFSKNNDGSCNYAVKDTTEYISNESFLVNETNSGIMNASELYPTENPAEFRPANSAYTDLTNNNFLDTGFHFQMNTTMSTNKNPDLQQGLRESIEVPVSYVGPWNESSWQQYVPLK